MLLFLQILTFIIFVLIELSYQPSYGLSCRNHVQFCKLKDEEVIV